MRRGSGKGRNIVLAANTCWKRVKLPLSRRLWRKLSADSAASEARFKRFRRSASILTIGY